MSQALKPLLLFSLVALVVCLALKAYPAAPAPKSAGMNPIPTVSVYYFVLGFLVPVLVLGFFAYRGHFQEAAGFAGFALVTLFVFFGLVFRAHFYQAHNGPFLFNASSAWLHYDFVMLSIFVLVTVVVSTAAFRLSGWPALGVEVIGVLIGVVFVGLTWLPLVFNGARGIKL